MHHRYGYSKLLESEIPPELLDRCAQVLSFAARSLPIPDPEPRIVWVAPLDLVTIEREVGAVQLHHREEAHPRYSRILRKLEPKVGYTPGNLDLSEFWLQASIPPESHHIEFAVLHEWRHVWQKRFRPAIFKKEPLAEGDAYPYAYLLVKEYLQTRGHWTFGIENEINSQYQITQEWFEKKYPGTPYAVIA